MLWGKKVSCDLYMGLYPLYGLIKNTFCASFSFKPFVLIFDFLFYLRWEELWSLNPLASPVSRNLCRPFPSLHHPRNDSLSSVPSPKFRLGSESEETSDRKCASTASQRDILPAVCEQLQLHRGERGTARGAEQAAPFASIITYVLTLDNIWFLSCEIDAFLKFFSSIKQHIHPPFSQRILHSLLWRRPNLHQIVQRQCRTRC